VFGFDEAQQRLAFFFFDAKPIEQSREIGMPTRLVRICSRGVHAAVDGGFRSAFRLAHRTPGDSETGFT
jgi:hypothetical protein